MAKRLTKSQRPLHAFWRPGQVHRMTLADGFRFVVLVRDEPPTMIPIDEPGTYHIDIPELLAKGSYPIGVTTVDLAQVPAFTKLPVKTVNAMLDAMGAEIARTRQ